MEKNLKKNIYTHIYTYIYIYIYIYIKLNHFAVHLKLTQHCKSTILQYKKIFFKRMKDLFPGPLKVLVEDSIQLAVLSGN